MNPLVSVIIPAYNCESYIIETLESVRHQEYKNIEIIIVNDGSKDNTENIINDYIKNNRDMNIKQIVKENNGVSSARNIGLKESKGMYVAFLDSDDLWEPSKLKKQVEAIIDENSHACYCGYYKWYYQKDVKLKVEMIFSNGDILVNYLKAITWPQTSTWLIKKNILIERNICFDEELSWGEDFDFFAKVISFAKVSCVKEYLVKYRFRSDSLSAFNLNHLKSVEIWKALDKWLKDNYNHYSKDIHNIIFDQRIASEIMFIMSKIIKNQKKYNKYLTPYELNDYLDILLRSKSIKGLKARVKRIIFIVFLKIKTI